MHVVSTSYRPEWFNVKKWSMESYFNNSVTPFYHQAWTASKMSISEELLYYNTDRLEFAKVNVFKGEYNSNSNYEKYLDIYKLRIKMFFV